MEYLGIAGLLVVLSLFARWFQRAFAVDVPRARAPYQAWAAVGLALGVAAIALGDGGASANWAVGLALTFLYLSVTGAQKAGAEAIAVGDTIPAFSAPDDSGHMIRSDSFANTRVLLKFFRGHW